ncbi:MAG: DUF6293 family protein [Candidatus Micrarchaeota archaeon]
MKTVMVSIVGEDADGSDILYRGLREFASEKVVLLSEASHTDDVARIKRDLEKLKIPVVAETILKRVSMEEVFSRIARIRDREQGSKIIVNVDTDSTSSCIALSAAFVNGVQAIGVLDDKIIAYPIMKFSYYNALSDRKMMLLQTISKKGTFESLESLSNEVKMSLPLVTYHVRGARDKPGLEELGLIETKRNRGRIITNLSPLGKLIVNGMVDLKPEEKRKRRG